MRASLLPRQLIAPVVALALGACTGPGEGPSTSPEPSVASWGTMREVLRGRQDQARVAPLEVVGPRTFGIGALAGLAGEITVIDGRVLVSEGAAGARSGRLRAARAEDRATLLVLADVERWETHELDAVQSYVELEQAIAERLAVVSRDVVHPDPSIRVMGGRQSRLPCGLTWL